MVKSFAILPYFSVSRNTNFAPFRQTLPYELESFDDDLWNQTIASDCVHEELENLVEYLFGNGAYFEINNCENIYDERGIALGKLIRADSESTIYIPDVRGKVNIDPGVDADFYVVVDKARSEYRWVVSLPAGTEYSG